MSLLVATRPNEQHRAVFDTGSFTPLLDGTVLVAGGHDCNGDGACVGNGSAELYVPAGVPMPPLPAFPGPLPPAFPGPTARPTPLPPAAGPVPPNAQSWTVTVDNQSSEPAALFVADEAWDGLRLVGSATPNVVPAGATSMPAIVRAFDEAFGKATKRLVEWTVRAVAAAERSPA